MMRCAERYYVTVATRHNSASISCYIVATCTQLVLCRRVWQGAENAREAATLVRVLYDNLRERYKIGTTYAPPTFDGKLWRDFFNV